MSEEAEVPDFVDGVESAMVASMEKWMKGPPTAILTPREMAVVAMRTGMTGEGCMSWVAIAHKLGVSRSRAGQIYQRGEAKMRAAVSPTLDMAKQLGRSEPLGPRT